MSALILLACLATGTTMEEPEVQVMIAARELEPGRVIGPDDLRPYRIPPDYVANPVVREADRLIGRVPRERILKGEFVREERLAPPEAGLGLGAVIPRGLQLLDIPLDPVATHPSPGAWVDLVALRDDTLCAIADHVAVVAVRASDGSVRTDRSPGAFDTLYVALTPTAAQALFRATDPIVLERAATDHAPSALPACGP